MPADPAPLTPDALFAALNAWVRSFDPRAQGLVILYESGGIKGKIPVPIGDLAEGEVDDPSANLSPMEAAVLEVIRERMKSGEVWSYDKIAKESGFENTGPLRTFAKAMFSALRFNWTNRGWKKP